MVIDDLQFNYIYIYIYIPKKSEEDNYVLSSNIYDWSSYYAFISDALLPSNNSTAIYYAAKKWWVTGKKVKPPASDISPASAFDRVLNHKIRGITFRVTLLKKWGM